MKIFIPRPLHLHPPHSHSRHTHHSSNHRRHPQLLKQQSLFLLPHPPHQVLRALHPPLRRTPPLLAHPQLPEQQCQAPPPPLAPPPHPPQPPHLTLLLPPPLHLTLLRPPPLHLTLHHPLPLHQPLHHPLLPRYLRLFHLRIPPHCQLQAIPPLFPRWRKESPEKKQSRMRQGVEGGEISTFAFCQTCLFVQGSQNR